MPRKRPHLNGHTPNGALTHVKVVPVPPDSTAVFSPAPFAPADWLAERTGRLEQESDPTGRLTVRHQLTLGVSPTLYLEWQADQRCLDIGCRVHVFRNGSGFAPLFEATPLERVSHGEQTVDANANGCRHWQLRSGDLYVTVMLTTPTPRSAVDRVKAGLRHRVTGSAVRVLAFVRFSVTVPGAETTIERISQDAQLHEVQDRNLRAREKLARRLNRTDHPFEVDRHARRTRLAAEKLIVEYGQIQQVFAEYRQSIQVDPTLSDAQRQAALDQHDALLRAQLAAGNYPFIDRT